MRECEVGQTQLWQVWEQVQVLGDMLQREMREPVSGRQTLRSLLQLLRQGKLVRLWTVQLCLDTS